MTDGRIISTPDVLGGNPRIKGERIGVSHIVSAVILGDYSAAEVHTEAYPFLERDDVHAALRYYYTHRVEIDHQIAWEQKWVRENTPSVEEYLDDSDRRADSREG